MTFGNTYHYQNNKQRPADTHFYTQCFSMSEIFSVTRATFRGMCLFVDPIFHACNVHPFCVRIVQQRWQFMNNYEL